MKLSELQASFQNALLAGDPAVLAHISDSPKEANSTLLGVYQNAYLYRLIDFIANDFERLHTYIGDDMFFRLARDFIKAHPSRAPNARWYGRELPHFIETYEPLRQAPMAAAVAKLEGALNDVFDCADTPALSRQDLSHVPPEDFAHLTFTPHASARRFDVAQNLDEVWTGLDGKCAPPSATDVSPAQKFLVWRHDLAPRYRVLDAEEAMAWDEMAKGVRFSVLCEMLATSDDPASAAYRAAQHLQTWLSYGLLDSARVLPRP